MSPTRPRAILIGLAIGVFAAILLAPPTRWIVRSQLNGFLGREAFPLATANTGYPAVFPENRWQAALRKRPDDMRVHLAFAVRKATQQAPNGSREASMEDMADLVRRYPDEPAVYAATLRVALISGLRLERREDFDRLSGRPAAKPTGPAEKEEPAPSPEVLAQFDRYAARGAVLDPDNAFFPTMRAIGHFAGGRDDEGIRDLIQAGSKPKWDDHLMAEIEGLWAVSDATGEGRNTIERTSAMFSVLLPHMAVMRDAVRIAIVRAVDLEVSGRPEEGIAIRMPVARLGALMRRDGRFLITNLVGIAITRLAMVRPGGAPAITSEDAPSETAEKDQIALENRRTEAFATFLERNGHAQDAAWIRQESPKGYGVRKIGRGVNDVLMSGARRLFAGWLAAQFLLNNALWSLILAAVAALVILARMRAPRNSRLREATGRWILPGLLVCIGAVATYYVALETADNPEGNWFVPAIFGVAVAAAVIATIRLALASTREEAPPTAFPVLWAVLNSLAAAIGIGLLFFVIRVLTAIQGRGIGLGLSGMQYSNDPPSQWEKAALLGVLIPVLLALVVLVASRIKREKGFLERFPRAAVPTAAVLVLLYGGAVLYTARESAVANRATVRMMTHEGRYYADRLNLPWPE